MTSMAANIQLDAAVVRALRLDSENASNVRVTNHGGSGFSSTAKISCLQPNGIEKQYFMKTGSGSDKAVMFEGEHASLNAIHDVVPTLCPASLAFGTLDSSPGSYFLVTDFLDFTTRSKGLQGASGLSLAKKLAQLHTTPAPTANGKVMFGFPRTNCCGDTAQDNSYRASWAEFFAENRLKAIMERSEQSNGHDPELRKLIEQTLSRVVPSLLGDGHLNHGESITPVVCHGDLWSGNKGWAVLAGVGGQEEVVFDPRYPPSEDATCLANQRCSEYLRN